MESPNDYNHTYDPRLYKFKSQKAQNVPHKIVRIADTYLVVVDNSIIRSLHLDENTWFIEEADETGIHLTFSKLSSETTTKPVDHEDYVE